ncbi:hypothetical protein EYF80_056597 [Liparis tanakae]|uniref:Uncharacterized protein n=1 Tax=Liparis tanakae TaxID=230148 RepID=A0A4Z2EWQ9_9TELE|nr:hypothetical protein EYF80_056597 [Liparis tanakae]
MIDSDDVFPPLGASYVPTRFLEVLMLVLPVNSGPGHVEGPGHHPIGGGAGQPKNKNEAGDLGTPTVVTVGAQHSHEGVE